MEIKSASFVKSYPDVAQCPADGRPEFAFIGRSNVGKSSLINMLTGREGLAKTSSKPGKTLLINHFLINEQWYIVDLPGYGYAQVSIAQRDKLYRMITRYVQQRESLYCLFVLIDSRLKPQQIDLDFIDFLGEEGVPFALVFTKSDKVSQAELKKNLEVFQQKMQESWEQLPPFFLSSSAKKRGREELLDYIGSILAADKAE
ncbi:MAG: YihA family ribosome biogenesis GTP-binding protein [Bacteroidales bacterium]|nr:YihA family ribosome biogenesis GTP-binding protein [Bacteroidales bacterium]